MRIGQNPNKHARIRSGPDVTIGVVVHIPSLAGYFARRLELLELTIASIHKNTTLPFELAVWDNGSCSEVRTFLTDLYDRNLIQSLFLSRSNLGALGAFNRLAAHAHGKYFSFCDDDMLLFPGWLESQLDILEHFPDVGMVSGLPTWQNFVKNTSSTLRIAEADEGIVVERSRGWPQEWIEDYCSGTGRSVDDFIERCRDIDVLQLNRNGSSALATCTHCQFVVPIERIRPHLPFDTSGGANYMDVIDETLNESGLMRLSTLRPYAYHMGNQLSQRVVELSREFDLDIALDASRAGKAPQPLTWLLRRYRVRRILRKAYDLLFKWVSISEGRY